MCDWLLQDHGAQATRVCLLAPAEPNVTVKSLLLRHKRVTYLKGDAMVRRARIRAQPGLFACRFALGALPDPVATAAQAGDDLARARADAAAACFVLTNRFTPDTDEMDSITVLRALNVKAYNPNLSTFVQIIGTRASALPTARLRACLTTTHAQSRRTRCMSCRRAFAQRTFFA